MSKKLFDPDVKVELIGTDSKKWNNYPKDVIPMWIADTDFKCPQPIIDALVKRAELGIYGYPLVTKSFNQSTSSWLKRRFNWEIDYEWVEFAPAVVAGIVNAIQAMTNPGDQVVVMSPIYHPFHSIINNCGLNKVVNHLKYVNNEWEIDYEDLEKCLADSKSRALILCNPHNPLGKVYTLEELTKIGNLCLKHNVIVISDEIHSDLVYKGAKHICFPSISKEFADISMSFYNPSKTFNVPGMRTAAAVIPNKALRDMFHNMVIANRANGATTFGMLAYQVAYNECADYVDDLVDYIENNFNTLEKFFSEKYPQIKVNKSKATYLIWIDFRALNMSQPELMKFLLEKAKVALNDGSTFGNDGFGFARMNIACHHDTLLKALKQIGNAIDSLHK